MNAASLLLLGEGLNRRVFEWGRIQSNSDWIPPLAALAVAVFFTWRMYRRDGRELGRTTRGVLAALRSGVFLMLLILYLQPQWRVQSEQTVNSRVVLLADTSLSMGLADAGGESQRLTRADYLSKMLGESDFLQRLRRRHDLVVYRFDEEIRQAALLKKQTNEAEAADKAFDWKALLKPRGAETRLGDSLAHVIHDQRDSPLSAVICVSDGCQNMGTSVQAALRAASEAKIPIHTIGVGSQLAAFNVRVSDLILPARAYPDDEYTATGFLQGYRAAGKSVAVELLEREADEENAAVGGDKTGTGTVIHRRDVVLGEDGSSVAVKFKLTPQAPGRRTLCFKVAELPGEIDTADNLREADVEIVEKKCRVLLFSGGPSREYRFLRNMLHRDSSVQVDVLLQTARPGISQDAHAVLDDFPATPEEMSKYDCLVALDPDWRRLDDGQLKLLEAWVAQQGGGLLVAAASVNMGNTVDSWIEDPRMGVLRDLYPVRFQRRFAVAAAGYTSKQPWPLAFTRDGRNAEFLWLTDDCESSKKVWAEFAGVFGFFPIESAKPAASVFARFSDPAVASRGLTMSDTVTSATDLSENGPVYFAGHFYGSGKVFYMGGCEMWRLRRVNEACFEQFYTKLIRHLSQGRLLRGSERGSLLVDRERYMLGSTAEVRARLTDAQLEPLEAASVSLQATAPDTATQTVLLKPEAGRRGAFVGHVPLMQEGVYRLELAVPQSDNLRLRRRIQVKMPDLERQNPQRNDALLGHVARYTGGRYYTNIAKAVEITKPDKLHYAVADNNDLHNSTGPLLEELKDCTKTIIMTAGIERLWQKNWLLAAMILICVLLTAEWLIRRLMKLA